MADNGGCQIGDVVGAYVLTDRGWTPRGPRGPVTPASQPAPGSGNRNGVWIASRSSSRTASDSTWRSSQGCLKTHRSDLDSADVNPGETITGSVVFDVPAGTPLKVAYTPELEVLGTWQ